MIALMEIHDRLTKSPAGDETTCTIWYFSEKRPQLSVSLFTAAHVGLLRSATMSLL